MHTHRTHRNTSLKKHLAAETTLYKTPKHSGPASFGLHTTSSISRHDEREGRVRELQRDGEANMHKPHKHLARTTQPATLSQLGTPHQLLEIQPQCPQ